MPILLWCILLLSCTAEESENLDLVANRTLEITEPLILLDQSYGPHLQHKYDIYLPAGRLASKTPVLVLIHGGGWTDGDKGGMNFMVEHFRMLFPDHAIANIDYALANPPEVPAFPNQFEDVELFLDHLESKIDAYRILPAFGFVGISAGAHLGMMVDYKYDATDRVKMVCNIVGPADLTDPHYIESPYFETYFELFTGPQYTSPEEAMVQLSPITHVTTQSSPTLMFYGFADPMVPWENGEVLSQALSTYQVSNGLSVYEGGHFFNWEPADLFNMYEQIESFVWKHLPVAP